MHSSNPEFEIYIRNADKSLEGLIDYYTNLEVSLRFNAPAYFSIKIPIDLTEDEGINEKIHTIQNWVGWKKGIALKKPGQIGYLLTGDFTEIIYDGMSNDETLTLIGAGDLQILNEALALPEVDGGDFSTDEYDVRTDNAETIMKEYVDYNIGPNATADRKNRVTIETDASLGGSITGRARFDNLLLLLQSLAVQGGGLGFRVVQSGADLEFQVYEPTDLSDSVIFSKDMGNLPKYRWVRRKPKANYGYAGGDGEGITRTFREKSDSGSISTYGRMEKFYNNGRSTDTGELDDYLDEQLELDGAHIALEVSPIDIGNMEYGIDYDLGSKVGLKLHGEKIEELIREVKIKITPNSVSVQPYISSNNQSELAAFGVLMTRIIDFESRIEQIEKE